MPPKKVGGDSKFIERRRRGLSRFLNYVANHSVLSQDNVIVDFFTTAQNLKHGRDIPVDEELSSLILTDQLLATIPMDFDENLTKFAGSLSAQLQSVCAIITILDKFVSRLQGIIYSSDTSQDFLSLSSLLPRSFYQPVFCDSLDYSALDENIGEVTQGASSISTAISNQSTSLSLSLLESTKSYRDLLSGFLGLLSRKDINYASLSLSATRKRISINKNRLVELTTKGSIKEIDRVISLIEQDEKEAAYQSNRISLIQYCISQEIKEMQVFKRQFFADLRSSLKDVVGVCGQSLEVWNGSLDLEYGCGSD